MSNPNAGPWAPAGHEQAQDFILARQEAEREQFAASAARTSIRKQMEASGEIEAMVDAEVNKRMEAGKNAEN